MLLGITAGKTIVGVAVAEDNRSLERFKDNVHVDRLKKYYDPTATSAFMVAQSGLI